MNTSLFWGPEGQGTLAAKGVGLNGSIQPLMVKSRDAGGDAYVFATGDKVYLWNMPMDEVFEYVKPTNLKDILVEMGKPPGKGAVELKGLQSI